MVVLKKAVILAWIKVCLADLAEKLTFLFIIIPHEIVHRGITGRTMAGDRNIVIHTAEYESDSFMVTLLIKRDEVFKVSVLFERDIFTDKVNKPEDLFM